MMGNFLVKWNISITLAIHDMIGELCWQSGRFAVVLKS